jgi:hypothetical protein
LGKYLFFVSLLFLKKKKNLLLGRTNNPFAPSPLPAISTSNQTQQQRRPSPAFNLPSTYELHSPSQLSSLSSSPAPSHTPSNQQGSQGQRPFAVKTKDQENETLAALFADREGGQDTFGNIGALRFVVFFLNFPASMIFFDTDMDIRRPVKPSWHRRRVQATTLLLSNSKITTNLSSIYNDFDLKDIPTDLNLCPYLFFMFGL